MNYLNKGKYFGIDNDNTAITTFFGGLIKYGLLSKKKPVLKLVDGIDLTGIGGKGKFDMVFTNSVFTHIHPLKIEKFIRGVIQKLNKGGVFYASFWLSENGMILEGKRNGDYSISKQPLEFYSAICENLCNFQFIGDRPWKTNQQLLKFIK